MRVKKYVELLHAKHFALYAHKSELNVLACHLELSSGQSRLALGWVNLQKRLSTVNLSQFLCVDLKL